MAQAQKVETKKVVMVEGFVLHLSAEEAQVLHDVLYRHIGGSCLIGITPISQALADAGVNTEPVVVNTNVVECGKGRSYATLELIN